MKLCGHIAASRDGVAPQGRDFWTTLLVAVLGVPGPIMAYLVAGNAGLCRGGFERGCLPRDWLSAGVLSNSTRLSKTVKCVATGSAGWGCPGMRHQVLPIPALTSRAGRLARWNAIAGVEVEQTSKESADDVFVEDTAAAPKVDYNWETEWYPLYLQTEVPTDAPLGLTVFDRSLVLFYDGKGVLNCLEDRCPHRAAKLSEGQIADGRLECLYHGWQFEGNGSCSKIPQLPAGAKIPKVACARSYAVQESQGVIWVWMAEKESADLKKIPWFEQYATEGYQHLSTIHELPYDYSILLENLMDPAHVPISHDRTDILAKRENAQALIFHVTERSSRGFAGKWGLSSDGQLINTTRFQAPCVLRNDNDGIQDGQKTYRSAVMLCRPAGQGRAMLIIRFGSKSLRNRMKWIPRWLIHAVSSTILEQDMGFLASQNETLVKKGVPTKDLYLNLKSCDTFVQEFRKWMDLVGHGMPYYVGHRTTSPAPQAAVLESAPVGPVAAAASSYPAKGSFGHMYARDHTNRYFRHVVHCKDCRGALNNFKKYQEVSLIGGVVSAIVAILLPNGAWKTDLVVFALLLFASSWVCLKAQGLFTTNVVRKHRK